jgi:hypothetical protein
MRRPRGGAGLPMWHCPKANGGEQGFEQTVKQGRKAADLWVPWHSSGTQSNEFESNSKFKWFK